MPRMELRGVEEGNPFYYNTEGGGALSGFGTIRLYNTGSNLTIYFDSSNAHVDNDGSNVKIYNDHSNNWVYNGGTNVEINSSAGFRELDNEGSHVTINSTGSSSNWIGSNGSNVVMNLGAENDYVGGHSAIYSNVTVNSEGGDDIINTNYGRQVIVNAGTGNDRIENLGSENTLNGGDGMDTIAINGGSNILANAGAGNDIVWCTSDVSIVTINGGDGDDEITNYAQHVTIAAGNDKDSIFNHGSNVTVNAGDDESDDEINNTGSNVTINAGLGNDLIVIHEGTNITAYGGRGNDTISIYDGSSNVEANSGAGNDKIWCTSDCYLITINSGEGDDEIGNDASSFSIQAGFGNDKISNGGNNMYIDAGADNDFIETSGTNVTVRGDNGDDKVNLENNLYNSTPYIFDYSDGDGNDVVNKYVMIYLRDGAKISDMKFDGNDIIYYIGNGSIRIVDGVNGDPQHPGYFYSPNESDNPNNLPANVYVNLPPLGVDYLKDKIYEQINTNLDGFLATFDDDPMKSILEDGINSPYLAELSPEIAEQIANSYKDSYETAKNLQNLNSENDYQTAYLKLKNNWNDAVGNLNDLLSNVAGILEIADVDDLNSLLSKNDTRAKLLSTIATRAQLLFSIKDSSDKTKLLAKLKKDFKNKYPNADIDEGLEIEQYKNIFGDTQRLIYPNFKIREIDPDFYDNIRLLEIDAEYAKNSVFSNIGAMILSANSPVIGAIVTGGAVAGVASGVAVGAMIPIWMSAYSISKKAAEKANYLDGVHLGEQNWYLTWGEQFLGLDYGTVKNWLKGKTGGESPDLVSNYVITNGVVNAISGDVANDGSLDHATLTGSEENDTLVNSGDYSLIEGYNGDNVVINAGDGSTITTGNGNDSVINIGDYSMLVVSEGNDTVENGGEGVTIDAGEGDDYITNSGNFAVINSGNGADYIDNVGNSVQINTGTGDDDVENFGNNVIINAGNGVDYIIDFGSSNSINAGAGDDFIDVEDGYNNIIAYADGEGNDTIYGYNESDIINLTGGTIKNTVASGDDLIINFDTNSLTFKNSANLHVTYVTNLNSANSIPMLKSDNVYTYTGGDRKIENYSPNEKVKLSSDFTGIGVEGNNFLIKSSSGALTLENVRDKLIDVASADGNTAAYVYMPSGEGDVNGSGIDIFEVIVASEGSNNHLIAGNGGSSLIGGGGVNILQGGAGQDAFVYKANNDTINNYQSGEIVNFSALYTGWAVDGNDFILNAAEGSLRITDAKDKLIEVAGADGNLVAHVYKADSYEGTIDGRGFNKFEVIIGADNANNQIFADAAGSSMWGGRDASDDELFGNTGVDEYIYSYGNGHDNIFQAGNEDTVNLLNISLEQIAGAEITDNGVIARFTDGGSLNISGQAGNFKLGGQTFYADYQNKIWC